MVTARVHSFELAPDETLYSLQKRIEGETKIEVVNQELLQETGVSLDPRKPAAQCVLDGVVRDCAISDQSITRFMLWLFSYLNPLFCREVGIATLSTCLIRASTSTLAPSVPDSCRIKSTLLVSLF